VSVPVVIEAELVGTLTIGFEITAADIMTLKRATNSNLLLVCGSSTVLSTLDSAEARSLLPVRVPEVHRAGTDGDTVGTAFNLTTKDETYVGTTFLLNHPARPDSGAIYYLIIKSLSREVRQSMASILGTFGIISLIFLALTTVIGLVISRSMTRPIRQLVQGTTAISQGNYDYVIPVRGKDELSLLAQRFMEMSGSLKEKITQLGKLNQDLLERNRDLDETLRQLRSAQEQLVRSERLAATGKLTAQLAHEVNNPIHNIQSCLQTALSRLPLETKGRELIGVAYDEVNRLSRLTVQMLDFYRSSLVEDEMKPTNIAEVVHEVVAITQAELRNNRIEVNVQVDDGLPLLRASPDKLKQVLLNLIANAHDAMPDGGHLDILACRRDRALRITVRDDGSGIAKEHLDRIFDAFFTTKGKVSGVGLGLSVSYGIVNQHRGSIEVESTVGRGSAFTVVLPCEA
jgi:signal transduction histidine kinase